MDKLIKEQNSIINVDEDALTRAKRLKKEKLKSIQESNNLKEDINIIKEQLNNLTLLVNKLLEK